MVVEDWERANAARFSQAAVAAHVANRGWVQDEHRRDFFGVAGKRFETEKVH